MWSLAVALVHRTALPVRHTSTMSRVFVTPTAPRRVGACRTSAAHVLRCVLGTGLRAAVWGSVFNLAASVRADVGLEPPPLRALLLSVLGNTLLFALQSKPWQQSDTMALMVPEMGCPVRDHMHLAQVVQHVLSGTWPIHASASYKRHGTICILPPSLRPAWGVLSGTGLRQVRGRAKGFWAAKVLSVSAKAGALIWHRHFNLKKVVRELKRAAHEVPCGALQGAHAVVAV